MDDDKPACASCKVSFVASDSVSAAICGHLFHEICVDRIICGNTKKCPECRVVCQPSQLLRIYLPFLQETSTPESVVTNYKLVKHQLKEAQMEYDHAQIVQFHIDNMSERNTTAINKKNEKLAELRAVNKEKEKLQKEIKKLEKIHAVQKVLVGSQKDVERMLDQKLPADTLATMAVVLKRETQLADTEKTDLRLKMREEQKENRILTANYRKCRDKIEITFARNINNGGGQN